MTAVFVIPDPVPGVRLLYSVGDGLVFSMRYALGATFTSDDQLFTGDPNLPGQINVSAAYWIGETEVTYQLWATVYTWATSGSGAIGAGQYHFQNAGVMGDGTDDT